MSIKHRLRVGLHRTGYDLVRRAQTPIGRQRRLMRAYGVDLVLDVGANAGQYGSRLRRELGYSGRIISFEPLMAAYQGLMKRVAADSKWEAHQFALGDRNGHGQINVAGNSVSSSLLEMLPAHSNAAPESTYVGQEAIEIRTLDSVFPTYHREERSILLKIDAQGFETQVLDGAEATLKLISALQLELSLVPLYADQALIEDVVARVRREGFDLVGLEPGFVDPDSGALLQVDGIFHRYSP
jgi:FkbM family methyltransferase